MQQINDAAICCCDFLVVLTPDKVPAEGTKAEEALARGKNISIIYLPPGNKLDIDRAILKIKG